MNNFFSLISIDNSVNHDILIELLRSCPAWIALAITALLPFITKRLEIEKAHKQFIFEEKYKIYSEHFGKLYDFNNTIRTFLFVLNEALNANGKGQDILDAKQNLYLSWDNIKNYEAKLWVIAPEHILQLRINLLMLIKKLKNKINSIERNGYIEYSTYDLAELVQISEEIQIPLSKYLDYYRNELEKSFK